MSQTPTINSLLKAMDLLRCFTTSKPVHNIQDLTDKLGIPRSTVHRLLHTLQQGGYVINDGHGSYRLGMIFVQYASAALSGQNLIDIAHDDLQILSNHVEESICLQVLDGENAVCIDEIQPYRPFFPNSKLGLTLPALSTASGRMILSQISKEMFIECFGKSKLSAYTPHTITKMENLWVELQKININGYAFDNQELELGMCCLAVPIKDGFGKIVAAFNINTNYIRLNENTLASYLPALLETSKRISDKLSGTD